MAGFAIAAVGIAAIIIDLPQKLLEMYLWSPLWSRGGGPLRYHWMLVGQYPIFWATLPIAAVIVFARRLPAGIFCVCVFGTAILIHSFAGMKAERFIYYAMPCFFVLTGILVAELTPYVRGQVDAVVSTLKGSRVKSIARVTVSVAIIAFLVFSNPAIRTTADILRGQGDSARNSDAPWSRYQTDWGGASEILQPRAMRDSAIVVTSQGLHLLYHFNRLDIELSASRLSDLYVGKWDESKEFIIDRRTGVPVISSSASFRRVRECFASGTVIVHENAWENSVFVADDVAEAITNSADEIVAAEPYGLRVFHWATPEFQAAPQCELLPVLADKARVTANGIR